MQVKLFSQVDGTETWEFETECDVAECFPDDPDSTAEAEVALHRDGEFVTGGGAAPLFKLVAVGG